jgi:hypothetical protein
MLSFLQFLFPLILTISSTIIAYKVARFAPNRCLFYGSLKPSGLRMGFFDDLKVIFSKEGQENIKAYNEREKEEMLAAQKEILARRSDPSKMRQYEEEKEKKRKMLAEERALYKFQRKEVDDGYDPLNEWKKLKDSGKIKMSRELERDKGSSRLGSEGLIDVRVDERMPYIDQGYVDESADVMGKFMGLFGQKNKKKDDKNE